MSSIQTLSTAGLRQRDSISYWNQIACSHIAQETINPIASDVFWGRMRCLELGALRVIEVSSTAARVECSRKPLDASTDKKYLVYLQLTGDSTVAQDGRIVELTAGDITLCDASHARVVSFDQPVSMLVMSIPESALKRRLASPDTLILTQFSGKSGPTAVASACLRQWWNCVEDVTPASAPRFADIVVDLIATALSSTSAHDGGACRSTHQARLRRRIVNHIEESLGDPSLSAKSIAGQFGISVRHLYSVFAADSEGTGSYVTRRRLEESARLLGDPLFRQRSVTAIAFDLGFRSVSQFSKVFKAQYGVAPSVYRGQSPVRLASLT